MSNRDEGSKRKDVGRLYLDCQDSLNEKSSELMLSHMDRISSGNLTLSVSKSLRNKASNMNTMKNFNDVVRLSHSTRPQLKTI